MINVDMTIREAIALVSSSFCTGDLYEKIVKAIEKECGESDINVTLRSMPANAIIPCIKALRLATGWGLKESKDFCDVVRGRADGWNQNTYTGGTPNTLILKQKDANTLVKEWRALGCDVVTDTFNC